MVSLSAHILELLDPYLIGLYRISGVAFVDYFAGTFLLALGTVVVGELTLSFALRFNRRHIRKLEKEMTDNHELSLNALAANHKRGYKACNDQANEAFGKYFFSMIAHSAALLWPIPFALSWMQSRFWAVEFPFAYPISLVWSSTGYFTTFILCYILGRILFKNMRPYLPHFREVQKGLDCSGGDSSKTSCSENVLETVTQVSSVADRNLSA